MKIAKPYETFELFCVTVSGMSIEMSVTDVKARFGEVLQSLEETGPVTIVRHSQRMAVLGLIPDPALQMNDYIDLFREVGGLDNAQELLDWGLYSPERMREFLALAAELRFDPRQAYISDDVETSADDSVQEIVAQMYLGSAAGIVQRAGQSLPAWARVLADLHIEAQKKDQYAGFEFDSEDSGIMETILATGLTPENFRTTAQALLARGVSLNDIPDALGEDAVPLDILAMGTLASHTLSGLIERGMARDDAHQLMRNAGPDYRKQADAAMALMTAGVTTYAEIAELQQQKISIPLARRAHAAGLAPGEWRDALKLLSRYSYGGKGLLPFGLLLEAARRDVSLAQWDKSSIVADPKLETYNTSAADEGLSRFPWRQLYPDKVIELAEVGVTPGYVDALNRLLVGRPAGWTFKTEADELVKRITELYQAGLKLPIIRIMARTERGRVQFLPTPEELMELAQLNITEGEARHLIDVTVDPKRWLKHLREYRAGAAEVKEWVTAHRQQNSWAILTSLGQRFSELHQQRWSRQNALLMEGVTQLLKGGDLTLGHISLLAGHLEWYLEEGNESHAAREFRSSTDTPEARRLLEEMKSLLRDHMKQ